MIGFGPRPAEAPDATRWAVTPLALDEPGNPHLAVDCSTCGEVGRVRAGPGEYDRAVAAFAAHAADCPEADRG